MVGRRSKLGYGTAVGTAAVMLAAGCGVITGDSGGETVLVGVDLELTGDGSALGTIYQQALELRVNQVNQQGLLGDRELALEITDNRSDAATATNNVTELAADSDVRAIITGGCDECSVAAAEVAGEQAVPVISLASSDQVSEPVAEREYMFKLGPNAGHNAAALTSELTSTDAETVGLLVANGPYGEDGEREMLDAADRAGIEVVVTEQVNPDDESSIAAAAAQVITYQDTEHTALGQVSQPAEGEQLPPQPDAVVIWAPGRAAGDLAAALRDNGYEGNLLLDASAADELFLAADTADALNGSRMVFTETLVIDDIIATSPAKAARQTWFRDYLAQVGTYHAAASFAADAIQLIVEAIDRFDSTERNSIRTAIEATQTEGLTGPLRMSAENHSGLMPQALTTLVARDGRWRVDS